MNKIIYFVFIFLFLFFTSIVVFPIFFSSSLNPEAIKESISSHGIWAPAIIMAILIFLSFFSIIPNVPFVLSSGYIFGVLKGTIYTLVAVTLGTSLVFFLSRKFGRPFVEKIVKKKNLVKADTFVNRWGVWALLVERIIPMFPENVIGISFGLTKMRYRVFIGISLLVFIPGAIMQNYIGARISDIKQVKTLLLLIVLSLALIILFTLLFKKRIHSWLLKETKILESDIEEIKGFEEKEVKKIKKFKKKEIKGFKKIKKKVKELLKKKEKEQ